jgi:glutamate synthase domain-containing protein 2
MKVDDSPENRERCICPKCPTYARGCETTTAFCAAGHTHCDISAMGCICTACPVYREYRLEKLYFCDKAEIDEAGGIVMRKQKQGEDDSFYRSIVRMKEEALRGMSTVVAMGSRKKIPFSFDDLHFIPAQVERIPLNREEGVDSAAIIGPSARRPLRVTSPILISGMSFGATSRNVHQIISRVAATLGIAFNTGEGGVLPEVLDTAASWCICQYSTGRFGVGEEILKRASAVEIRFGQGAYPGKGSYLPAAKITPEVASIRGLEPGEDANSPAHHPDMVSPDQIREKVEWLREITGGVPIGAKIGCGRIEDDCRILVEAGVDFIAIDGFGGGTGATYAYIRENVGLPLIAALPRAHRFLSESGERDRVSLIAGGGLRSSADFAKCLALGADSVYIGTAALIAMNCEQYRICHTGLCPTGITTQDPVLMQQLKIEDGTERLSRFIRLSAEEMAGFTRIVGKPRITDLDSDDLVCLTKDLAVITGCRWLDGKQYS